MHCLADFAYFGSVLHCFGGANGRDWEIPLKGDNLLQTIQFGISPKIFLPLKSLKKVTVNVVGNNKVSQDIYHEHTC